MPLSRRPRDTMPSVRPKKRAKSQHKSRPKPDHKSKNTGPQKPSGIKSTAKQVTSRVRETADLICSGYRRCQIHETICGKYGVSWRTAEEYSSRAREMLIEESGKPFAEHRAEVFGKYQEILRSKKTPRSEQLAALKGKRDLLGLDPPRRNELSGPDGEVLQITAAIDTDSLERLSDDHIFGILKRYESTRKDSAPIISLTESQRGPEPGAA